MICQKCGSACIDGAKFCDKCGASLSAPAAAQPVSAPAPVYNYSAPAPTMPGKGFAIAGMVLGIVALAFFCFWPISLSCGIVGSILSAISLSKTKPFGMKNPMATAGVVCSIIAVGLMILFILLVAAGIASAGFSAF